MEYTWADLDAANKQDGHYRRPRNERAEAERKVWDLRKEIDVAFEDNPSSNYHVTLRRQDIMSILVAAAVTCRTDLAAAANLIEAAANVTGRPLADMFSERLHALALEITGEADDLHEDFIDQQSMRHGG